MGGVGWVGVGFAKDFSVSPSPLGTDWDQGLTELGLGLGDLGLGTRFDNYSAFNDLGPSCFE